jgi:hypothetical protein
MTTAVKLARRYPATRLWSDGGSQQPRTRMTRAYPDLRELRLLVTFCEYVTFHDPRGQPGCARDKPATLFGLDGQK